jgi:hypothetical protein
VKDLVHVEISPRPLVARSTHDVPECSEKIDIPMPIRATGRTSAQRAERRQETRLDERRQASRDHQPEHYEKQ